MQFDLGPQGLGILVVGSLIFGGIAQIVLGRGSTPWVWLIGAVAWFVGRLIASEVVWGPFTAEEIQPIIDGLAFDESLLGGLVVGVPVVLVAWYVTRRRHLHGPMAS